MLIDEYEKWCGIQQWLSSNSVTFTDSPPSTFPRYVTQRQTNAIYFFCAKNCSRTFLGRKVCSPLYLICRGERIIKIHQVSTKLSAKFLKNISEAVSGSDYSSEGRNPGGLWPPLAELSKMWEGSLDLVAACSRASHTDSVMPEEPLCKCKTLLLSSKIRSCHWAGAWWLPNDTASFSKNI